MKVLKIYMMLIWKFAICFIRLLFILYMMKINNFINNKLFLVYYLFFFYLYYNLITLILSIK
jgi:hypothetical protein